MFDNISIASILISLLAFVFSLSVHEASHAGAAYLLDDDTAYRQGRLTLNPVPHVSVLGTLVMPILGALSGWPVLAWAKPVPVNPAQLSRRFTQRTGIALVSAAGPASNLVIAAIALVILGIYARVLAGPLQMDPFMLFRASMSVKVEAFLDAGLFSTVQVMTLTLLGRLIMANIGLAIFNLLPVGPLDGAGIFRALVPNRHVEKLDRYQQPASLVLLAALLLGLLDKPFAILFGFIYHVTVFPIARLILGV